MSLLVLFAVLFVLLLAAIAAYYAYYARLKAWYDKKLERAQKGSVHSNQQRSTTGGRSTFFSRKKDRRKRTKKEQPNAKLPILQSIDAGDLDGFNAALQGSPALLSYTDDAGNTLLHIATGAGKFEMVSALLDKMRNLVNARNKRDETALHTAAGGDKEGSLACLSVLLDKGDAQVNALDCMLRTPLHHACSNGPTVRGSLQRVEVLILHSQNNSQRDLVHTADTDGDTPLHAAAFVQDANCIKLLLGATNKHTLKSPEHKKQNAQCFLLLFSPPYSRDSHSHSNSN